MRRGLSLIPLAAAMQRAEAAGFALFNEDVVVALRNLTEPARTAIFAIQPANTHR